MLTAFLIPFPAAGFGFPPHCAAFYRYSACTRVVTPVRAPDASFSFHCADHRLRPATKMAYRFELALRTASRMYRE